ncbi:mercury resistance system transport protein MerF [Sneathiella sp.]|uniref:mercury resistance system transport protein MerF n=1 Tax=Sneathiella sp. TaxID=1964365 RepID=UPI003FA7ABEA
MILVFLFDITGLGAWLSVVDIELIPALIGFLGLTLFSVVRHQWEKGQLMSVNFPMILRNAKSS